MKRFVILITIFLAVSGLTGWFAMRYWSAKPVGAAVRAIWVTRFDYGSEADVRSIVRNLSNAGFTDIFFQIRGNGTAFYESQIDPWAYELSGGKVASLGRDPGWDPLRTATACAKASGIRLHAYMNVLPGWKGLESPPVSAHQLWTEHRDWFMVDSYGTTMLPTAGWYSFLNPAHPEVQNYLECIVAELCRYDVAGIHLDYIRYPHDYRDVAGQHYPDASREELRRRSDFSYDPVSQALLFDSCGWDVTKEDITEFRCETVTRTVRGISRVMQEHKPNACLLSASVMGNPVDGRHEAYQDSGRWVRESLVDWVVQMNYGTRSFERYLKLMKKAAGRRRFSSSVVVGIYCKNDLPDIHAQLERVRRSGCRGFSLFSYSFLYDKQHQPTKKGRSILPKIRP